MSHMRLLVAATIIAGIIIIGFVLSVPHTRDVTERAAAPVSSGSIPSVVLHDAFKKGVHTITGSIEAPNPCTSLSVAATIIGSASTTEGILLDISMPEDSGVCLEESTTMSFSTTIAAPADLPITASVNGVTATTTTS